MVDLSFCLGQNRQVEGAEGGGCSKDEGGKVPGGHRHLHKCFGR